MTLASSINSSSLIVFSFIIFIATSILPLKSPRRTTCKFKVVKQKWKPDICSRREQSFIINWLSFLFKQLRLPLFSFCNCLAASQLMIYTLFHYHYFNFLNDNWNFRIHFVRKWNTCEHYLKIADELLLHNAHSDTMYTSLVFFLNIASEQIWFEKSYSKLSTAKFIQ